MLRSNSNGYVLGGGEMQPGTVTITTKEYLELVGKANKYDVLSKDYSHLLKEQKATFNLYVQLHEHVEQLERRLNNE